MGQERRSFGSIERRSGYFRARYVGPDRQRYEAPNLFSDRIDAEFWLGEVHRSISRQEWRPPVKVKGNRTISTRSLAMRGLAWRSAS